MAAKHYLAIISGHLKEVIATIISTGIANEGDIVALNSQGHLDPSLMPVKIIPASENLSEGNFVNIWKNGSALNVQKADATSFAKKADGFVLANVLSGANAVVYTQVGLNNKLSGLNLGDDLYLSDSVAGGVTATPPTGTSKIVQLIAKAISITEADVNIHLAIELA